MGCGCGKGREVTQTVRDSNGNMITKVRNTVKRVWESTQAEQPTHVVKRINKK